MKKKEHGKEHNKRAREIYGQFKSNQITEKECLTKFAILFAGTISTTNKKPKYGLGSEVECCFSDGKKVPWVTKSGKIVSIVTFVKYNVYYPNKGQIIQLGEEEIRKVDGK